MKNSLFTKQKVLGLGLAVVIASSAAVAQAGPHFFRDHGMHHPIERMLDRLDLSDEQELQTEEILATVKEMRIKKKGMKRMRSMLALDPDAPDYMLQAEEQATKASEQMKAHIMTMASARKEIHNILTDEQKKELKRMVEKKMNKMDQRCDDDD